MLNNLSFSRFTTTVSNLWNTAKSYVNTPQLNTNQEQKTKTHSPIDYKHLLVLATLSLFSANRNQAAISLGLVTMFADSVNAAYPTVTNPIPVQYVNQGQSFSFDIDLSQVFNDTDGDVVVYAGTTMADGMPLLSWIGTDLILLGGYNTAVSASDVAVQNNVAYVVAYDLFAINVTNPKNLVLLDSHRPSAVTAARGVALQGQVAYLLHWSAGYVSSLQTLDISNPKNLVLLSNYALGGSSLITGIALRNTLAYIMNNAILQILNISNPVVPVSVTNYSNINLLSAQDIAVQSNIAYIAHSNILGVIDVSNVNAPALLSNLYMPDYAYGLAVQNNTAYVACGLSGLQLVNVTDKRRTALLGNYAIAGVRAEDVVVQGQLAYVASGGLQIVNVTNVLNPFLLHRYYLANSNAIAVQKGVAYVATDGGLLAISLNQVRISGYLPTALTGSYNFTIYVTNANNEKASTYFELRIIPAPSPVPAPAPNPAPAPVPAPAIAPSPASHTTSVPPAVTIPMASSTSNSMPIVTVPNRSAAPVSSTQSTINSPTTSMITSLQSSVQSTSNAITFSVITSIDPILIELSDTVLTTDMLSISGNVNSDQVVYTVQGDHPNIVITINGIETTQFTQADVEGQLVEIALTGVTCGDYSTDLQLEANVAGSNEPAQQVSVALIFEGTTCAKAKRSSAFSFREVGVGFWGQGREVEQEPKPEKNSNHVPMLRY